MPAAEEAAAPAVPAPAPSLGRPMTLKEKLAAARSGGTTPAAGVAAKPAAAKPAAGAPPRRPRPRPARSPPWRR